MVKPPPAVYCSAMSKVPEREDQKRGVTTQKGISTSALPVLKYIVGSHGVLRLTQVSARENWRSSSRTDGGK